MRVVKLLLETDVFCLQLQVETNYDQLLNKSRVEKKLVINHCGLLLVL